jgi:hypothetical protein
MKDPVDWDMKHDNKYYRGLKISKLLKMDKTHQKLNNAFNGGDKKYDKKSKYTLWIVGFILIICAVYITYRSFK